MYVSLITISQFLRFVNFSSVSMANNICTYVNPDARYDWLKGYCVKYYVACSTSLRPISPKSCGLIGYLMKYKTNLKPDQTGESDKFNAQYFG